MKRRQEKRNVIVGTAVRPNAGIRAWYRFIAPVIINEKPAYAKLTVKETHTDNKIYKSAYTVELHSLEQVTEGGAGLDNWI